MLATKKLEASQALRVVAAAALALASISAAHAAFEYRVKLPGLQVGPTNGSLALALNSAVLPDAIVGSPYTPYDFSPLVSLSGTNAPALSALSWSAPNGLPAGLTLSASGVLSGTPTVKNESGASTLVRIAYQSTTGQHAYTLRILDPVVSLSAAAMPAAKTGEAYFYDFKSRLGVIGDPNFDATLASFSRSGALPAGLTLGADGVLAGTPTTINADGNSFQLTATYKNRSGQQTYTLVVNGATLEVTQVVAGSLHACALTTAGGVVCWGGNSYGQLGNGTTVSSSTPVAVVGLTADVKQLDVGTYHTCAVTSAGGVKCWGDGSSGQLGNGATANHASPVDVAGLATGVASVSGGGRHTCAVTTAGGAKCWGSGSNGQLGNGATGLSTTPVDVSGLTTGVARVDAGFSYSCALTTAGGVKCWGANYSGQLGNGTTVSSSTPVNVSGLASGATQISAGQLHTCASTSTGAAKCWGDSDNGQLGDGSTTYSATPVNVTGLSTGVSHVSAGGDHTCAVTTTGGVKCWGYGYYGQLGAGNTDSTVAPVDVVGLTSGATSVSSGGYFTCAVTSAGGAKCWGANGNGRLGNGALADSLTPVDVVR